MKKLFLVILMFISVASVDLFAQAIIVPVPIAPTLGRPRPVGNKGGRSVAVKPQVWLISASSAQLTISFAADDSYTLYVYDGAGGVVYQGSLITDGGRHFYQLPDLDSDLYTLSIDGDAASFEGEFFVN